MFIAVLGAGERELSVNCRRRSADELSRGSSWAFITPKEAAREVSCTERVHVQTGQAAEVEVVCSFQGRGINAHLVRYKSGEKTGGVRLLIRGSNGKKPVAHYFKLIDGLVGNKFVENAWIGSDVDKDSGQSRLVLRFDLTEPGNPPKTTPHEHSWRYVNLKLPESADEAANREEVFAQRVAEA